MNLRVTSDESPDVIEGILKEITDLSNAEVTRVAEKKDIPLIMCFYDKNEDGSFTLRMTFDENVLPLGYGKLFKWKMKRELQKSFKKKGVKVNVA